MTNVSGGFFRPFFRVLSLQLKARTGLRELPYYYRSDKKTFLKKAGLNLLIAVSFGSLLFAYCPLLYFLMSGAQSIGLGGVVLAMVFLAAMLVMAAFGVFTMTSIVFSARDYDFYAAMPIRSSVIFASKFSFAYLYDLMISLFFTLPAVIILGSLTQAGVLFYLKSAVILVLLPAVPLAAAGLLALVITRLSGLAQRRDLFITLLSIVLLFGVIFAQVTFTNYLSRYGMDPGAMSDILTQSQTLIKMVAGSFPPAAWAASFLSGGGAADGLLYLGSSIGFLALIVLAGGVLYRRGALSGLESGGSGKKGYKEKSVRAGGGTLAVFLREWKLILRSPIYAMNCLVGIVILPLFFVVLPLLDSSNSGLSELISLMKTLPANLSVLLLAGLLCFIGVTGTAASSSVSREGPHLWIARTIPLPLGRQILAKLLCGLSITVAGMLITSVLAVFFLGFSVLSALIAFVLAGTVCVSSTAAGMLPDILRPKLAWSSETEAIKQNLNVMLGMVISLAVCAVFGLIAYLLKDSLPPYLLYPLIEALAIAAVAALSGVMRAAETRLRFA